MPRFYTLVVNDASIEDDDDGLDFETEEAAISNASRAAVALLEQHIASGAPASAFKLFVRDDQHRRVATVSVMGAVIR